MASKYIFFSQRIWNSKIFFEIHKYVNVTPWSGARIMEPWQRTLELRFPVPGRARSMEKILAVEAGEFYRKVKISLDSDEDTLRVRIDAKDTSSLRAAMSSVLNWVGLMVELERETGKV